MKVSLNFEPHCGKVWTEITEDNTIAGHLDIKTHTPLKYGLPGNQGHGIG